MGCDHSQTTPEQKCVRNSMHSQKIGRVRARIAARCESDTDHSRTTTEDSE